MSEQHEDYCLYDVFSSRSWWIKLPTAVMRDCGSAAQTLGAILRYVTVKETFASAKKIAARIRQPLSTYRKHAAQLDEAGYLRNLGRQAPGENRRKRRTATIRVLQRARTAAELDFGVLPWWATGKIRTLIKAGTGARYQGRMPWCAKAVLSIVMARLFGIRAELEQGDGEVCDSAGEELWMGVEHFGGEDKFKFSLAYLQEKTGLQRAAVVEGKKWLTDHGIVERRGTIDRHGGDGRDILYPNPEFRFRETPAGEGKVWIDLVFSTEWRPKPTLINKAIAEGERSRTPADDFYETIDDHASPEAPLTVEEIYAPMNHDATKITKDDLEDPIRVNQWIDRNLPPTPEGRRLQIQACSIRALNQGDDPPKLFHYLVRRVMDDKEPGFNDDDLQAASHRWNRARNGVAQPAQRSGEPKPLRDILFSSFGVNSDGEIEW